jgi:hypothetical protein
MRLRVVRGLTVAGLVTLGAAGGAAWGTSSMFQPALPPVASAAGGVVMVAVVLMWVWLRSRLGAPTATVALSLMLAVAAALAAVSAGQCPALPVGEGRCGAPEVARTALAGLLLPVPLLLLTIMLTSVIGTGKVAFKVARRWRTGTQEDK